MSDALAVQIARSFSSVESLKQTMVATAETMFGPGFVWLVALKTDHNRTPNLKLLNTYLAGTPYPEAHYRRQSRDMNTEDNMLKPGQLAPAFMADGGRETPLYGSQSSGRRMMDPMGGGFQSHTKVPGSPDSEPLLCVSTWPHVYLEQFGVAGKREYLEKWWDYVNWSDVDRKLRAISDTKFYHRNTTR